jgi:uracil phosphoribosyltransferase
VYSLHVPVHLVDHPVVEDALLGLRDRSTPASQFRVLAHRVSLVLVTEASRDLRGAAATVHTPLEPASGRRLREPIVAVPVLRAGLGMMQAVLDLLPTVQVGHIGLQRDEQTAIASQYLAKLPADLSKATVLLVDPMLATGGSAIAAADLLVRVGVRDLRLLCIVSAPEGIAAFSAQHPTVPIYTAAIDRQLNDQKFILPGLGDFGDRLYGT